MHITRKQAAIKTGVSLSTILRWVEDGKLVPGPKQGRSMTVTTESLRSLMEDENFMAGLLESQMVSRKGLGATLKERVSQLEEIVEKQSKKIAELFELLQKDSESLFAEPCNSSNTCGTFEVHSTTEQKKEFINGMIKSFTCSIMDICPEGRGSSLGRWLRSDDVTPTEKNINKWYERAWRIHNKASLVEMPCHRDKV